MHATTAALSDADAPDRLARHLATVVARALERTPEKERAVLGVEMIRDLLNYLQDLGPDAVDPARDSPLIPGQVLARRADRPVSAEGESSE